MPIKLFGTDGIRCEANSEPMTPETIVKIAKATGDILFRYCEDIPDVVIARDTRVSGPMIEAALIAGFSAMGADVHLTGIIPTPAVPFLINMMEADAGVMISASHNPADDNGIKLFSSTGYKLTDEEELDIERSFESKAYNRTVAFPINTGRYYKIADAQKQYIDYLYDSVLGLKLFGLKIVIDCANGAASPIVPELFDQLGAKVYIVNNQTDGERINEHCGSTCPESIQDYVMDYDADLGISFDGDADRVIMCDEYGHILNGDHILGICGIDLIHKNELPHRTIVATQYSNSGLDDTLKKYGGHVVRVLNGDRYVIEKMNQKGYILGGESSGHIIFKLLSFTGDGILTALQVLNIMSEYDVTLSMLRKGITMYPQYQMSVPVSEKKAFDQMPDVKKAIDDVRLKLEHSGRVLVRYSGTESKVRIMVEGQDKSQIESDANYIADAIVKDIGIEK